jgi:hypothetical protein
MSKDYLYSIRALCTFIRLSRSLPFSINTGGNGPPVLIALQGSLTLYLFLTTNRSKGDRDFVAVKIHCVPLNVPFERNKEIDYDSRNKPKKKKVVAEKKKPEKKKKEVVAEDSDVEDEKPPRKYKVLPARRSC